MAGRPRNGLADHAEADNVREPNTRGSCKGQVGSSKWVPSSYTVAERPVGKPEINSPSACCCSSMVSRIRCGHPKCVDPGRQLGVDDRVLTRTFMGAVEAACESGAGLERCRGKKGGRRIAGKPKAIARPSTKGQQARPASRPQVHCSESGYVERRSSKCIEAHHNSPAGGGNGYVPKDLPPSVQIDAAYNLVRHPNPYGVPHDDAHSATRFAPHEAANDHSVAPG